MVSVKIKLFEPFAEIVGHKLLWIKIKADNTVEDVLTTLDQMSVGTLKKSLIDTTTEAPHQHVTILVNGLDIDFLAGLKTALKDKDTISILSPVVGG